MPPAPLPPPRPVDTAAKSPGLSTPVSRSLLDDWLSDPRPIKAVVKRAKASSAPGARALQAACRHVLAWRSGGILLAGRRKRGTTGPRQPRVDRQPAGSTYSKGRELAGQLGAHESRVPLVYPERCLHGPIACRIYRRLSLAPDRHSHPAWRLSARQPRKSTARMS